MTQEEQKKYYNKWMRVYNSRSGLQFIHPGIMERLENIAEEFNVELGNII
jgi:hypothetical protein